MRRGRWLRLPAKAFGDDLVGEFCDRFDREIGETDAAADVDGVDRHLSEQWINSTWRPTLSYIGADGFPPSNRAGNVLRPFTTLSLSFRLPPTCDANMAIVAIERAVTTDVP